MTVNTTPNPKNQKQVAKAQDENSRARRERVMIAITAAICFAGIVQACSAIMQWKAMQRALDTNERAWVIMSPPSPMIFEPNSPITLTGALTNYGKSPAFHVTMSWNRLFSIDPPPPEPQRLGGEPRGPLVPGQSIPVNIHVKPFSTPDTADVKAGSKNFFLVGNILYSDPFSDDKDRFTRVCWQYLPVGPSWKPCDLQTYR